ncbi:hypothetical protein RRG08_056914 [Elysia crispata]|uniref:Uncharacterized protein n=1 Tax=Elysia crispata TaxID=231223 RepID=A0AAE1CQW5_9GAST|nr:hypothetical protein RRG08_056914 [Elysia crispata]
MEADGTEATAFPYTQGNFLTLAIFPRNGSESTHLLEEIASCRSNSPVSCSDQVMTSAKEMTVVASDAENWARQGENREPQGSEP